MSNTAFWNYTELQQANTEIKDSADFEKYLNVSPNQLSNINFISKKLNYIEYSSIKSKFNEVTFTNAIFDKSTILKITFRRCTFRNCYFVGTTFTKCVFTKCKFENCNTFKFILDNTTIDPEDMKSCIKGKENSNVGLETFIQLLKTAKQIQQPDYIESADYYFRLWKRYNLRHEYENKDITYFQYKYFFIVNILYQKTIGYGYRFSNFIFSFILSFAVLTFWNYIYFNSYTLKLDNKLITNDSPLLMATYITFRNITAYDLAGYYSESNFGLVNSILQGLFGFVLLGMLVALITKKIIRS